ncbi:hypothetical protein SAY86_010556 [Trapa natans]|uniref:TF-B3 domain-containing protein n=1 Tax=Trapa natans TaxID=22666 RepID=A0AAN7R5L1_TRANT|nr:hypothetical protein SAY86_010556 [Trapa natans]
MDAFHYPSPSSSSPSNHHHHRTLAFVPSPHPPPPPAPLLGSTRFHLNSGLVEEEPEEASSVLVLGTNGGAYSSVVAAIEKEHMFDKVVTPSDVGKLNRLVIPKQHAERFFPLDSSSNEKGLLLNFEDRNGKPWRFRYSYWNSSQSYVMTKGWSRFVKEKKLDAGDIVSFQRGVGDAGKDRLFIDWRRRPHHRHHHSSAGVPHHGHFTFNGSARWASGSTSAAPYDSYYLGRPGVNYGYGNVVNVSPCGGGSVFYLGRSSSTVMPLQLQVGVREGHSGGSSGSELPTPVVFNSVPVVQGKAAAKRLRLFGVNMDCPASEPMDDPPDRECQILFSTSISHGRSIGSPQLPPPRPPPPTQSHHQIQSIPAPYYLQAQNPHRQLKLHNSMPVMNKGKASSSSSSFSLDLDI